MKEKAKAIFDNRSAWALIGTLAGYFFSPEVKGAIDALGLFVMAII